MLTGFTVFLSLLLFNLFSAITSADQTGPTIKSSKYSASSYHAEYTWKGLHLRETRAYTKDGRERRRVYGTLSGELKKNTYRTMFGLLENSLVDSVSQLKNFQSSYVSQNIEKSLYYLQSPLDGDLILVFRSLNTYKTMPTKM